MSIQQWYSCSGCGFESEKFTKETKIKEMETVTGTRCKVCGCELVYNAG